MIIFRNVSRAEIPQIWTIDHSEIIENTINFYLHRGCEVTPDPDPVLFRLEPEDIHLVCEV